MLGVLTGFGVVFIVIAVGYLLGVHSALGNSGHRALASFVYSVATPALLFDKLTKADPEEVFHVGFFIIIASILITGLAFYAVCRLVFRDRVDEAIIGMLAASYSNGGNLGIPLAVYLLDDATAVVSVILVQVAFYAPVALTAVEIAQAGSAGGWKNNVAVAARNPMLLAAGAGILFSLTPVEVPTLIREPVAILAGASVPLALVVFGMSLVGARLVWSAELAWAVVFKNLVHPAVAFVLATYVFGLEGVALYTSVFWACLPTAQNVYAYAVRFQVREEFARDCGVLTTLAAAPVLVVVSLWLG